MGDGLIPIARPQFGAEEEAAVLEVMRSGTFAQGPRVKAFEESFAAMTGANYAVATSNGTTALYLALLASGVGQGDEVITSPLTFIATANAIAQTGARPVFADVDDTLNLDPRAAAAAITPRTRAIVPVHLHGNPADVPALLALAAKHGLLLIQDACQAVGATIESEPLGKLATAVYSFYATKNLTTGEGGMITTNDERLAKACASLRHQAYGDEPYTHDAVGYNFRMTEIQAAIGLVQIQRLPQITQRRRETASYYDERIIPNGFFRPRTDSGRAHVYHQYTLRVADPLRHPRDSVRESLSAVGIGTGVYYPVPVHRQPAYRAYSDTSCPNAEQAARDMISIPVHPGVSDSDRERVASALSGL
jgi:dTDP-4-amino-4,6-dideoxygalactose transaminase